MPASVKSCSARIFLVIISSLLFLASGGAESLGPVSEETPPATCNSGAFISEIKCTGGDYCDNKTITCYKPKGLVTGRAVWTDWISEEGGLRVCPAGYAVAGLACNGDFCDNISLYCVEVVGKNFSACVPANKVSEENSEGTSVFSHPNFDKVGQLFLASGINCSGFYCDDIALQSCEIH